VGSALLTISVTSVAGDEHEVTDENMSIGIESGVGRYTTVCGDSVIPAAMSTPPSRKCLRCVAIMQNRISHEPEYPPRRRRRYVGHRGLGLIARFRLRFGRSVRR
jgi:hypothetical protein